MFKTVLASLCVASLALTLAACGGSSSKPGGATPSTPVMTPASRPKMLSIFQADWMVQHQTSAVVPAIKTLGAQAIHFDVDWNMIAPDAKSHAAPADFDASDPAAYPASNWKYLDNIDRTVHANGMQLFLTLTTPAPVWATGANSPTNPHDCRQPCTQWKPNAAEYGKWVQAVAKRYSGGYKPAGQSTPLPRVNMWSLINEPNYGPNLAPQSKLAGTTVIDTAAPQYRALLDAGWQGLNAGGHSTSTDTLLIGETAPAGEINPGTDNMTPPLRFMRDLYCVSSSGQSLTGTAAKALDCDSSGSTFVKDNPALFKASGWATHPYQYPNAPDTAPKGDPAASSDWGVFADLPHIEATLDKAGAAYGVTTKLPIYNTEFGYITSPPNRSSDYLAVSIPTAAKYINWAEYLSWKDPRIRSYDQYLYEDSAVKDSPFSTGLVLPTGAPKQPLYNAYQMPLWLPQTTGAANQALDVWGCARPVQDTTAKTYRVQIQFASGNSSDFSTVKQVTLKPNDGGCYFNVGVKFPHSGNVRLLYSAGASSYTSRVQAITIQ